jgi:hypothetical protein
MWSGDRSTIMFGSDSKTKETASGNHGTNEIVNAAVASAFAGSRE